MFPAQGQAGPTPTATPRSFPFDYPLPYRETFAERNPSQSRGFHNIMGRDIHETVDLLCFKTLAFEPRS
jgi:hypothetical protein